MSWLEDWRPLPGVLTTEDEDPSDVVIHVFVALAAGISAVQLLAAIALGQPLAAALFTGTLAATGMCAVAWPGRRLNRSLLVIGGAGTVLVWIGIAIQASGPAFLGALVFAGAAAALTRRLVRPGSEAGDEGEQAPAGAESFEPAWIEDDREGFLPA